MSTEVSELPAADGLGPNDLLYLVDVDSPAGSRSRKLTGAQLGDFVRSISSGDAGADGWSPILANVADGARRVQQIIGWVGGTGEPPAIGAFVGPEGLVAAAADAMDLRGVPGAPGAPGDPGVDGDPGADGVDGLSAWTPVPAIVADGQRRVLQINEWIGGEGQKPPTGLYVGDSGTNLTPDISLATDLRGANGEGGGTVVPEGAVTAGHMALFADAAGDKIRDGGLPFDGLYASLRGKPAVFPTNWANVADKPAQFPPAPHTLMLVTDAGTLAGKSSISDADWSGADLSILNGGTGASTAAAARTNLGLGSVDNTSDADKPVSTAQRAAFDLKADKAQLGTLAARNTVGNADWDATDLAVLNGGTGASTPADARANLGAFATAGGTLAGALSTAPGALAVLTGGTTVVNYAAAGIGNRRRLELRSGANTLDVQNIPESGGDLELDILYTAGSLAFVQTINWLIGGGVKSTTLGDTGVVLTAGVRYTVVLWNMGGVLYGVIG